MITYMTVKDLMRLFHKESEETIRRWVREGREIRLYDMEFKPEKDPGGHYRFRVTQITAEIEA